MSYAQNLWLYFILLFGIIIVPGMDMFFVVANSLARGRAFGLAATAGIMFGGIYRTVFGALSVGVIAKLPPAIYMAILLAGAGYMAWIGITLLRSSITVHDVGKGKSASLFTAFWQGSMTCILNPKAYMFVLSVWPQFVQLRFGPVWQQAVVMGLLTFLTQGVIYGGLGLAAARSRDFMTASPQVTIWIGRGAGFLFVAVAALTAWHAVMQGLPYHVE